MKETWKCRSCGEEVAESYVECWNCQGARPGYSTPAEQVKRYDEQHAEWERQNEVVDQIQEDVLRQNRRTDDIQAEHGRQNRLSAELLELERISQIRLSALLDRWEKLTDVIESLRKA
jgi:hypothetical protein